MSTGRAPVFDASKRTRAFRTIIGADGLPAIEKRPIQKSIRAVNPAGHVCWVPLYTGPAQADENNPYRHAIMFSKQKYGTARCKKPGWLPLGVCPQLHHDSHLNLPESVRGRRACHQGAKGGVITDDNPCECVVAAIKERQARNNAEQAHLNASLKTAADRTAEQHAEVLQAAKEVIQAKEADRAERAPKAPR